MAILRVHTYRAAAFAALFLWVLPVSNTAEDPPQTPLLPSISLRITGNDPWCFDEHPNANSTDNLIFSSVSSLLQTWGNTRYHNGHTIIPGTIPPGTLLYHGTHSPQPPPAGFPEWLAVDPEHSYIFCTSLRSPPNASHPAPNAEPCWHLTFVTTRPIKVLYFDGASAGKMSGGSMDSQDIVIWGEVVDTPERRLDERRRANELCKLWGNGGGEGGVDGFVRMELDFEVLLCDLTDGLELVSALNLQFSDFPEWPSPRNLWSSHSAARYPGTARSDGDLGPPTFIYWLPGIRGLLAGLRHAHFPGETRVRLHYHHLITFYDTALFPSLPAIRQGESRWEHRLKGIAKEDVERLRGRLRAALGMKEGGEVENWKSSGVDWKTTLRVVQMRWEDGLEVLRHMLDSTANRTDRVNGTGQDIQMAKRVHAYVEGMLKSYTLNGTRPDASLPLPALLFYDSRASDKAVDQYGWAKPTFRLCATTNTHYLTKSDLTLSESLLVRSIRGVERELCRVLVGIWASGVEHGLDEAVTHGERSCEVRELLKGWSRGVNELMEWLDWSVWVKCDPACQFDETCYLPTWVFFPPPEDEKKWLKCPEPRCWKRIHPLQ